MAIPVINLTTSVLGYGQWEQWSYQPWATGLTGSNTWSSSTLPAGMTLDPTSGLISGAATVAGVYNVGITVSNSNGVSVPVMLTIGIEAKAYSSHSGVDLFVNAATGEVTTSLIKNEVKTDALAPVFAAKEGENRLAYIHFHKDGTILDLGTLTKLEFAMKEFDPDATVVVSQDVPGEVTFLKTGSGTETVYILHINFDGDALANSLTNYEADEGTTYDGIAEIAWDEPNATSGVGPATLHRKSRTFTTTVERNIAP